MATHHVAAALCLLLAGCSLPDRTSQLIEGRRPPEAMVTPAPQPGVGGVGAPMPLGVPNPAAAPARAFERRGSGQFVVAPRGEPAVVAGEGGTVLNLVNVDIREAVQTILGDTLGLAYSLAPEVKGTITVRSNRPVPNQALLAALENALAANGSALVKSGAGYRIVPRDQAPPTAAVRIGRPLRVADPGYAVQVVPLNFVGAAEMQKVLAPVAREGDILWVDPERNILILGGTQQELNSLLDLVETFDINWMSSTSVALYPLQSALAETLVEELETVMGITGGPRAGLVRLQPIKRLNAILVIAKRATMLDEVRGWIRELDRNVDETKPSLFIYPVQNGRASNLAGVLGRIFGTGAGNAPQQPSGRLAPGLTPVERTYRQPAGSASATVTATDVGRTQASPGLTGVQTRSDRVGDAPAAGRESLGSGISAAASQDIVLPGDGAAGGRIARVTADEANNSLAIMATPQDYRMIELALRKLDVRPFQILIEATIAEVTLNDQLRYGLQYFLRSGNFDAVLSQTTDAGTVDPVVPGFSAVFTPTKSRVVLSALEAITDLNVISSPQILVLNNQTATLQVGDQVPVPVQSAVSVVNPDAPIVNTIQYRDTGVILSVTPRMNASGAITLDIEQEVSAVVRTTSSNINAPTIQQRRVQSTIEVEHNETVALGGLIRDSRSNGRSGIPILSSLPVLGALFSNTDNRAERTELLILITPKVIRDQREARSATDELRQRMRAIRPL